MTEGNFVYVIDWELNQGAFRDQVKDLIHEAEKRGKVITLPLSLMPGRVGIDMLIALLSQVNCDNCQALCCRKNAGDKPISLLPPEVELLSSKYGFKKFDRDDDGPALPVPCPFLKESRCRIYQDRPFVCLLYPFQIGGRTNEQGESIALASTCPEGRRIARSVYMMAWRFRRQYNFLGDFLRGM